MVPTFSNGDIILVSSFPYLFRKAKIGDIILLKRERLMIKRITKNEGEKFFVEGDNKNESTDSRKFGWIERKDVLGKIVWVF